MVVEGGTERAPGIMLYRGKLKDYLMATALTSLYVV